MPMASALMCLRSLLGKSSRVQIGANAAKRNYTREGHATKDSSSARAGRSQVAL
jgi:hypothetical protein